MAVLVLALAGRAGANGDSDGPDPEGAAADPREPTAAEPGVAARSDQTAAEAVARATLEREAPRRLPVEPVRLRRSWAIPIAESAIVLAGFNLGGRALGMEFANITFGSIASNLTGDWTWDDDAFSTNQFGHPYMGYLYYSAARSSGFGVLGASAFTYVDSLLWELFMETEIPSLNDQIVTPAAGILLGEVLHRWSRSLLWRPGGARPHALRVAIATLLDPMGMVNRRAFGEAWSRVPPPPSFGWIAAGYAMRDRTFDVDDSMRSSRRHFLYGSLGYSYGLPTDPRFAPRAPLDHFEMRIDGAIARELAYASLRVRGLLWGRAYGGSCVRGLWGAFGGFDFENPERLRVSTLGLGIGTTLHAGLGARGFVQGTAIANVIPFGTAGGGVPSGGTDRDYHRGPGVSQLVEVKLGLRGRGLLRAAVHAYEINGTPFGEGSEVISLVRLGALIGIVDHHAIGIETGASVRRATFVTQPDVLDRTAQLRAFYAFVQDFDFGGGPAR